MSVNEWKRGAANRSMQFIQFASIDECMNEESEGGNEIKSFQFISENEMKLIDWMPNVVSFHSMKFIQWNKINEINLIELNWTECNVYYNSKFMLD